MGGCLPGTSMVRTRAFLAKGRQSEFRRLHTTWLPDSGRVMLGCLCMVSVLPGAGRPLLRWSNPTLPFLVEETEDWRQWVIWPRSHGGSWQNQEQDLILEASVPLCLCRQHSLISTNYLNHTPNVVSSHYFALQILSCRSRRYLYSGENWAKELL